MDSSLILEILSNSDEYVSGQALAGQLGVSRQAVWKEIKALRARGYEIESLTNRGYRLTSMPGYLNAAAVKAALRTAVLGCELTVLDSVGSTNDHLKAMGDKGCKSGTVVAAREQVSGKGRLGRTWQSRKDENLMFSFLLRPKMLPSEAACVTPLTGLAVCKALREFTGLDCRIKWPNDIIVGRKKLCGILTEMSAELDAVNYLVTGVGINVDQARFLDDIAAKATSLFSETGVHFDKNRLLAAVLERLEKEFLRHDMALSPQALEEYSSLCATLGRNVGFTRGGRALEGKAEGVDPSGALIVTLPDGTSLSVGSGEVTAQGIY